MSHFFARDVDHGRSGDFIVGGGKAGGMTEGDGLDGGTVLLP